MNWRREILRTGRTETLTRGCARSIRVHKVEIAGVIVSVDMIPVRLIHLISIPVTNTSVNPARSTGAAVFVGGWALSQLWLFWVAPIVGAAVAGVVYRLLGDEIPGAEGRVDETIRG